MVCIRKDRQKQHFGTRVARKGNQSMLKFETSPISPEVTVSIIRALWLSQLRRICQQMVNDPNYELDNWEFQVLDLIINKKQKKQN